MASTQGETYGKPESYNIEDEATAHAITSRIASTTSSELLSEGSRFHQAGKCKPCAFFHTRGCTNGVACSFCHACPPNEAQRRKRVRRQLAQPFLAKQKLDVSSVSTASGGKSGGSSTSSRASHSRQPSGASSVGSAESAVAANTQPAFPCNFANAQSTPSNMWPTGYMQQPMSQPLPQALVQSSPQGMCSQAPMIPVGYCNRAVPQMQPQPQPDDNSNTGYDGAMGQSPPQYMWVQVAVPMPSGSQQSQPAMMMPWFYQPEQQQQGVCAGVEAHQSLH